jgi:hypothetical protein
VQQVINGGGHQRRGRSSTGVFREAVQLYRAHSATRGPSGQRRAVVGCTRSGRCVSMHAAALRVGVVCAVLDEKRQLSVRHATLQGGIASCAASG